MWGKRRATAAAQAGGHDGLRAPQVVSVRDQAGTTQRLREELAALEDEDGWHKQHAKLVRRYNLTSPYFYVLAAASLCFAVLNGIHGYTTSNGGGVDFSSAMFWTAVVIGGLYFTVELTIPVSSHFVSWSSEGWSRWLVRCVGVLAFAFGVMFSLTILQSKFTSSSDSAVTAMTTKAKLRSSESDDFDSLTTQIAELTVKVKGRSVDSIRRDIATALAQPVTKTKTVDEVTDGCTGPRKEAKAREVCAEVDSLNRMLGNAQDLEKLTGRRDDLAAALASSGTRGMVVGDALSSERPLAALLGWDANKLRMMKSAGVAAIAALLTHMLWLGYGAMVNSAVSAQRQIAIKRASLTRAVARSEAEDVARAGDISATFASKRGAHGMPGAIPPPLPAMAVGLGVHAPHVTVGAGGHSPIHEQQLIVQVQAFFNDQTVLGDAYAESIGAIHNAYMDWCRAQAPQLAPARLDRFHHIVTQLHFVVTENGRVLGAALKHG